MQEAERDKIVKLLRELISLQNPNGYFSNEGFRDRIVIWILNIFKHKSKDRITIIDQNLSAFYRSRTWYTRQCLESMEKILDKDSSCVLKAKNWLEKNKDKTGEKHKIEERYGNDVRKLLLNGHRSELYMTTVDPDLFVILFYLEKSLQQNDDNLTMHLIFSALKHIIDIKFKVADQANLFWLLLIWGQNRKLFDKIIRDNNLSITFDKFFIYLKGIKKSSGQKGFFIPKPAPIYDITPEFYNTPFRTTLFCLYDLLKLRHNSTRSQKIEIDKQIQSLQLYLDDKKSDWIKNPYLISLMIDCEYLSHFDSINDSGIKRTEIRHLVSNSKKIEKEILKERKMKLINSSILSFFIALLIIMGLTGNLRFNIIGNSSIQIISSWASITGLIITIILNLNTRRK